jgi:hypothetical protein
LPLAANLAEQFSCVAVSLIRFKNDLCRAGGQRPVQSLIFQQQIRPAAAQSGIDHRRFNVTRFATKFSQRKRFHDAVQNQHG